MYGLFFGLVGLGLNIIFGVLRMINLAHGDFIMLGAFLAYCLLSAAGRKSLAGYPRRGRGVFPRGGCRSITPSCPAY